jgi:hypothetical protein
MSKALLGILLNVLAMSAEILPANHPSHQQKKCMEMRISGEREHWNHLDCDFWTSRDRQGRLLSGYRYRYLSYGALLQRMRALEYLYPELVTLQSAQDEYDLPVAGRYGSRLYWSSTSPLALTCHARRQDVGALFSTWLSHTNTRSAPIFHFGLMVQGVMKTT